MTKHFLILTFLSYGLFVNAQTKPMIEWVLIPAGTFTMGSPASEADRNKNETQHLVTLSAFRMSKYEVTYEQYDLYCNAPSTKKFIPVTALFVTIVAFYVPLDKILKIDIIHKI